MSTSMQKRQRLSHLIHRRKLWSLSLACVVVFALAAASAQALPVRGHALTGTFGSHGEGDGQLNDPGAVAVNETTEDVYLVDRRNNRVEQLTASGEFVSVWGWDVNKNGKTGKEAEYEVCTDECQAGIGGRREYEFNKNTFAIAVDNCVNKEGKPCSKTEDRSVGDVYVLKEFAKEEYLAISKFGPNGEKLEEFAYNEKACENEEKGKKEGNKANGGLLACELELETEEAHGLAVGSDGTLWLYYDEELYGFSDGELETHAIGPIPVELANGEPTSGLSVDAHDDFYVAQTILDPPQPPFTVLSKQRLVQGVAGPELLPLTEEVDGEQTGAFAASQANGAVYLDNENAKHEIDIAEFDEADREIQRFDELQGFGPLTVNGRAEDDHGVVYVPDASADDVQVFGRELSGPPRVDELSVQGVDSNSAHLHGEVDAHGAPTTYEFEYGTPTVSCASEPGACTKVSGTPGNPLVGPDEGFGDVAVTAKLEAATGAALLADTTYHYRLVASNSKTQTGHEGTEESREGTFMTRPVTIPLADERVWELVSPAHKNGAEVEPPTREGAAIEAAAGGGALAYVTDSPVAEPEGSRSLEITQDIATRGAGGWSTQDIVTPNERGTGLALGTPNALEYKLFSSDLSLAAVQPFGPYGGTGSFAEPPLAPPVSAGERDLREQQREDGEPERYAENTIYLRRDLPITPGAAERAIYEQAGVNGGIEQNPGYVPLVTGPLISGGDALPGFGSEAAGLLFVDATPDLSHAVIQSNRPLTEAEGAIPAPSEAPQENLYEWSGGHLQLVSVIEEAEASPAPAANPVLGAEGKNVRHAISDDGSRVFWSGGLMSNPGKKLLYMRDLTKHQTVRIDIPQGATPRGNEADEPEFQSASVDGSRVFFTDDERLTAGAGGEKGRPDLYMCEIVETAGKLGCELTDLTPEQENGESANVQGLVLGTSEEGSYVYFVADGVLAPGATPGRCGLAAGTNVTCNLYFDRRNTSGKTSSGCQKASGLWETCFIAPLSAADAPDWRVVETGEGTGKSKPNLGRISASVSPNGRYLAFMSQRAKELVGYDNRDTSEAADEALDEEVFLFDAESGRVASESIACASCDPSGARPHGVYDPLNINVGEEEGPEGLGLLVDRPQTWTGHWLAGSIPSWTNIALERPLYQPRYLSNGGRLFFQSPADLVPDAVNEKEDVYEYEPEGIPHGQHACTTHANTFVPAESGCLGLISSGTSAHESAFLDASESGGEGAKESEEGGGDVFFVTEEKLVPEDTDGSFDVYDAHECTAASVCILPKSPKEQTFCESTPECREPAPSGVPLGSPASGTSSTGNYVPPAKSGNKGVAVKSPPHHTLTRAQELARALKACHKLKHKQKRVTCEKQARKKYGVHKAKKADIKSSLTRKSVGRGR
jgi:hypothetical protein